MRREWPSVEAACVNFCGRKVRKKLNWLVWATRKKFALFSQEETLVKVTSF